jgi:hypothetical protein
MDQRRVIIVTRRQREVRRVLVLNLPSFDSYAATRSRTEYIEARFRILCQNHLMTPSQRQEQNVPSIVYDADELHFEGWMGNLRETIQTNCNQCGHSPTAQRSPDIILEFYPALKEDATCHHTICVFCIREKFRLVSSTIRCNVCSKIWLINSESDYLDSREYNAQRRHH